MVRVGWRGGGGGVGGLVGGGWVGGGWWVVVERVGGIVSGLVMFDNDKNV